jgi:hypothetical protein
MSLASSLRANSSVHALPSGEAVEADDGVCSSASCVRKAIELQPQAAFYYGQLAKIQILRGKSAAVVESAKKRNQSVLAHLRTGAGPLR